MPYNELDDSIPDIKLRTTTVDLWGSRLSLSIRNVIALVAILPILCSAMRRLLPLAHACFRSIRVYGTTHHGQHAHSSLSGIPVLFRGNNDERSGCRQCCQSRRFLDYVVPVQSNLAG